MRARRACACACACWRGPTSVRWDEGEGGAGVVGGRAAGARRTEKLLPFSARAVASPSGSAATEARMPTCSSAAMSSSARLAPAGSRFLRSAPANMTGSCGTTAAIARSSRSGMRSASTPPMRIAPPAELRKAPM